MNLRELKYVIFGEDRLSEKMTRIAGASDKATTALGRHSDKLTTMRGKYMEAASTVPALSGAMNTASLSAAALVNPITLVGAAVAGTALALRKGVAEASLFEVEFRKLENINLDKTASQINRMRDNILSLSMRSGVDANMVSQGYFDIQSLTGKSGFGTEYIVKRQAEFARAVGADVNSYVSGTGTAMKNFGFGPAELEEYNKSNMGVIAVAKLTYRELAEISAKYAGQASAANQSVNSANKLMALFRAQTSSAEEAATLTKSAFTDLFKQSTINSFKEAGISLYDVAGNAKQIDQIMLELNAKFNQRTSAKSMDELRNKFQGSEGINALLSVAMDKSGSLLNTFNDFDKAGAGLQKVLESANRDINKINDDVNNRLRTSWIRLGEAVLPTWIEIKKVFANIVELAPGLSGGINGMIKQRGINRGYDALDKQYKDELQRINDPAAVKTQYMEMQGRYRKGVQDAQEIMRNPQVNHSVAKRSIEMYKDLSTQLNDAKRAELAGYQKTIDRFGVKGAADDGATGANASIRNGITSVASGGTRNVTVTIQRLIENMTISTTNLTETGSKIKQEVESAIIKAVAGSEQILSSN